MWFKFEVLFICVHLPQCFATLNRRTKEHTSETLYDILTYSFVWFIRKNSHNSQEQFGAGVLKLSKVQSFDNPTGSSKQDIKARPDVVVRCSHTFWLRTPLGGHRRRKRLTIAKCLGTLGLQQSWCGWKARLRPGCRGITTDSVIL